MGFKDAAPVLALREKIRKALKLEADGKNVYEPHVTVGQCDQADADAFVQSLQRDWEPLRFVVSEVCLLHKAGPRYKAIARLALEG